MLLWVLCESMNFHPDEQLFQVKGTWDWTIVFILIIQKILLVEYFIIFKLTVFINPKHKTCKLKTYWEIVPSIIFLGYICNTKNAVTKHLLWMQMGLKTRISLQNLFESIMCLLPCCWWRKIKKVMWKSCNLQVTPHPKSQYILEQ